MIATVIPARLGSTRLPNKLVLTDSGRPLLYHTLDRVLESELTSVVFVVTEDRAIYDLVQDYNNTKVQVVMTGPAVSGTERIANFVSTYFMDDGHIIVNFQGDEPELPGHYIDRLATIAKSGGCDVATLASPMGVLDASSIDVVKVVTDHASNALWFSRHPIPAGGPWLKHVGIYAYSPKFLRRLFTMARTTAPYEKLEQLQWLQAGYKVRVLVDDIQSVGIDTPDDYARFTACYKRQRCQPASAT